HGAPRVWTASVSALWPAAGAGEQGAAAFETLFWPIAIAIVIVRDRGRAWRQYHPCLLGGLEYMDIGWQAIGFVQRADAHEENQVARSGVIAPECDPASRTADDLLALAAVRGRRHHLGLALEDDDAVG